MDRRGRYLSVLGITRWRQRDGARPQDDPRPDNVQGDDVQGDDGAAGTGGSAPAAVDGRPPDMPPDAPPDAAAAGDTETPEDAAPPEVFASGPADTQVPAPAATSPDEARAQCIARMDWAQLRAEVEGCRACPLHATRTRAVFGVGNQQADWLIVGEAPGADEDRLGEPFVGRAGRLLDLMLAALSLDRQSVYICNILKSRPPGNRDPSPDEMRACRPYLSRQIELVAPSLILASGRIAAQTLLESSQPVGRLRGQVHRYQGPGSPPGGIPLLVTYHPAYLLRAPREKRKSWADLQLAGRTLDAGVSPPPAAGRGRGG